MSEQVSAQTMTIWCPL